MKSRKGFTLTELLAVISILAILIGLGTMSYMNVRRNILQSQRDNLIEYIKTRAMKYADDTGITTVNVETLINEGYLDPDDTTNIYDPVTRNSMNCFLITSTYENGNLVESNVSEDFLLDTGKCRDYDIVSLLIEMCKYNASGECVSLDEGWTSNDVTLGVRYRNLETKFSDAARYEWSSSIGQGGTSDRIKVISSDGVVTRSRYQVRVTDGDVTGVTSTSLKIDNENPAINRVVVTDENTWTKDNKQVTIEATDFQGSGINEYFLGTTSDCIEKIDGKSTSLDNGTYYACVADKMANKSTEYEFKVSKIDKVPPVISVKNKKLVYVVNADYRLVDNVTVSDSGGSDISIVLAYINNKVVTNVNELSAGTYTVEYRVYDNAKNLTTDSTTTLTIFVPEVDIPYDDEEIEYEIPTDGKYQLDLWGAQGANNGGKGAYISTLVTLNKGDILKINTGGQLGYNGGGVGPSGTYNGGGATTIKLNGNYLAIAAGGGGGTSGGAGGSGTGTGGASVGSGAGTAGTNGGGGSSSPSYSYKCNCSTCGGDCAEYYPTYSCNCSTCGGDCASYYPTYSCNCSTCGGGCASYNPTYSCNCSTCGGGCAYYEDTYECRCSTCGGGCEDYDWYCDTWVDCGYSYKWDCCSHYTRGGCLRYASTYSCNCKTCGGGCAYYEDTYECRCSTCGGGCASYSPTYDCNCSTCGGGCKSYNPTYDCNCSTCGGGCKRYNPTYDCNCSTCVTNGNPGNGGSNYTASNVTLKSKTDGNNSGNGKVFIKYIVE